MLVALVACEGMDLGMGAATAPERVDGKWELHEVETAGGQVDAKDAVMARYPGCTWARMTWTFEADRLRVGHDVLCPASGSPTGPDPTEKLPPREGEYYGCQVEASVPATWDEANGRYVIAHEVVVSSRTLGVSGEVAGVPMSCEVRVPAGAYPVLKVRNQDWRWEMGTPDGSVYRLRIPRSDSPDFVSAIASAQGSQP